jgi:hypothetical protein
MGRAKRPRLLEPSSTNPSLTAQTEMEKLEAWIRNFVKSFELGKLRSILSDASFLRRPAGIWRLIPIRNSQFAIANVIE